MVHDAITSVPQSMGWVKNPGRTSARTAGKMRTRDTPFFRALVHASNFGSIPPVTVARSTMEVIAFTASQRSTEPSASFTPATSVRIHQRLRAQLHGKRRGHLVGIHVVVLAIEAKRQARYHGHHARIPEALDPGGINGNHFADVAEIRMLLLRRAAPCAGRRRRGRSRAVPLRRWPPPAAC